MRYCDKRAFPGGFNPTPLPSDILSANGNRIAGTASNMPNYFVDSIRLIENKL
jgi:hypothetical protein